MDKRLFAVTLVSFGGWALVVGARAEAPTRAGARYIEPVDPALFEGDLRNLPRAPQWRPGDPIKEIPKRRKPPAGPLPATPPEPRLDPLLEPQVRAGSSRKAFTTPALNLEAQGFSGVNPPDTVGDAGRDYYIQMINGGSGATFVIYDKADGSIAAGPITLGSLGSGDCANGLGDPIVLYDALAGRWLLSEFSSTNNALCVYVSMTGDPIAGGWLNYEFATPDFPDYPKYAVWPDAYYVTSNESSPKIYALERSQMLSGAAASLQAFSVPGLSGFGFQALTPADLDGSAAPPVAAPAYFARHKDDEVHSSGGDGETLADGSGSWQSASLDIGGTLGAPNVVVRFAFDTVDEIGNGFEGFSIDDVQVEVDGTTQPLDNDADWAATGLWHRSTACSAGLGGHTGPDPWYYGRDVACNYDTGAANSGSLDSPSVDLSAAASATLSFNYFLETEQFCDFDSAKVQLSVDGGTTFTDLIGNCVSYGGSGEADPTSDVIELWEVAVDWGTPANSTLTGPVEVEVADFDSDLCGLTSFSCFPQPSGPQLDPLREVIMWRLQYRNFGSHETLLGNFVTDATGGDVGGIRWFELRKSGSGWGLYQEGTYSPDDDNRWMGAIAMDGQGNIALGYNASNATDVFPGIRFTGRESGDILGLMPLPEADLIAGTQSNASNRYGDYSAMSVDPEDECTFWFTGQYNPAAIWSTRIGAFRFDSCVTADPSCSGKDVPIDNRIFDRDTTCVGTESISATLSTVQSGIVVRFIAPVTALGPGFNVGEGAVFRAGP